MPSRRSGSFQGSQLDYPGELGGRYPPINVDGLRFDNPVIGDSRDDGRLSRR